MCRRDNLTTCWFPSCPSVIKKLNYHSLESHYYRLLASCEVFSEKRINHHRVFFISALPVKAFSCLLRFFHYGVWISDCIQSQFMCQQICGNIKRTAARLLCCCGALLSPCGPPASLVQMWFCAVSARSYRKTNIICACKGWICWCSPLRQPNCPHTSAASLCLALHLIQ